MTGTRRAVTRTTIGLIAAGLVAFATLQIVPAGAHPGMPIVPDVAFLARADNPVDALAASSAAGTMGAPVLLTKRTSLGDDARTALEELDVALVVIAGGPNAISEKVEREVEDLGYQVLRVAGKTRTATARALAAFPGRYNIDKPLVTGARVDGDADVIGRLDVGSLAVQSNDIVPNLHADLLDGFHARELAHPPLEMQGLADLRPASNSSADVIDGPEGRSIVPAASGPVTLLADVTAPRTSSNAVAPLFGRLVDLEVCYVLDDPADAITGVEAWVFGRERSRADVTLERTSPSCETVDLPDVDASAPIRLAFTWEPSGAGEDHALTVFGVRTVWETATP